MPVRPLYLLALLALTPACASTPAQEEPAGGMREIGLTVEKDAKTGCTYLVAEKERQPEKNHSCNKMIVKAD